MANKKRRVTISVDEDVSRFITGNFRFVLDSNVRCRVCGGAPTVKMIRERSGYIHTELCELCAFGRLRFTKNKLTRGQDDE